MARRNLSAVVRYLRQLTGSASVNGASDAELLERYVRHRDEAAFELLLWRHGALVFNVCRRILPREQDAEDAFQATFLAFVRKAGSISRRGSVASWLYKVAFRVALAAKARARKTTAHEKSGCEALAAAAAPDPMWEELRPILDEEVNRLPEHLRRPFVLCYLEGKTNEEAARQLGCPAGTIFSRLARGRAMLRRRLQRRGVTLTVAALTAALWQHAAEAAPPALLMTNTVRSALLFAAGQTAGGASAQATTLAEGVLRTMFVTKLKWTALVVLFAGLFAAGGMLTRHARTATPQLEGAKEKDTKEKPIVSTVHPTPGGLQRISPYPGHVRAVAHQQVYPLVSGYLKRLAVDIGDAVKKGDVLAEVQSSLLVMELKQAEASWRLEEMQVEAAKAKFDTALAEVNAASDRIRACEARLKGDEAYESFRKKQAQRYTNLLKDRAIDQQLAVEQEDRLHAAMGAVNASRGALQTARSELGVKKSMVESAKVAVDMAKVKADITHLAVEKAKIQNNMATLHAHFDGIVTGRHVNSGDFVSASDPGNRQPLLTVMRTDPVRVVVDVALSDVPFIHPGVSVRLQTDALPDAKLPECKVSRTGYVIDEKTNTMTVEIDVPNPKNLLRPGMYINALIVLDKKAPAGAVTVPGSAAVKLKGRIYVYVVRDGKAHLTPIQMSYSDADDIENANVIEIESGVKASDSIVADPRGLKGEVVPVEVKKTP